MYSTPDLQQLAHDIHQENLKWWQDIETGEPIQTPSGQKEMLMISEVAEAMEGLRKDLMDDKLPHRKMAEVEAADYIIRVLDFAAAHNIELPVNLVFPTVEVNANASELMLIMCDNALTLYGNMQEQDVEPWELTDCICECVASAVMFSVAHGYDLWGAVEEKRTYNRQREDHKLENRKAEGGKKW